MAPLVVLAAAVGVVVLAAREGRRASRSRTQDPGARRDAGVTGRAPDAGAWAPVAALVAAEALTGAAPGATTTGPSRRACRCADRCRRPGTGASGGGR